LAPAINKVLSKEEISHLAHSLHLSSYVAMATKVKAALISWQKRWKKF